MPAGRRRRGAPHNSRSPLRMRELLLQEREVGGDFHGASEVSPEGAGLQGREEGVEFGEVRSLAGLLMFDGFDDGGEADTVGRAGGIRIGYWVYPNFQ